VAELLERESQHKVLEDSLIRASAGNGRIALVSGEAGIGKTALTQSFVQKHRRGRRVLLGACDPLFAPRPLGPVHDFAGELPEIADMLGSGASWLKISSSLLGTLRNPPPSIVVFEDIHWADEATLDLLKFLGRRIEQTRALMILTYRDDEVDRQHPLRSVLGDFPPGQTSRLPLSPLSERAVEDLAMRANRSAGGIHAITRGNPFFVTEVLKNAEDRVPPTVRDAVLTRAARLPSDSRALLDLVSIFPRAVDPGLVEQAIHPEPSAIDACVESGFLLLPGGGLAFRHELARRAIEESLAPARSRALHEQVLQAMLRAAPARRSNALIVHLAMRASNSAALREYAPLAAGEASLHGAHREAVRYYQAALEHADLLGTDEHAGLLDRISYEHYLTGGIARAIESREKAISLWRQLDRPERLGDGMRWLSRLHWFAGNGSAAVEYAEQAIGLLEKAGPGEELAMALSNRSQLFMLTGEPAAAKLWGEKALAIAEKTGSTEAVIHALTNIGAAELSEGDEAGRAKLERSLDEARAQEMHDHAARCYANLATFAVWHRDYRAAERVLAAGIAFAADRDMDSYSVYLRGWRARVLLEQGRWNEAAAEAEKALALNPGAAVIALPAVIALGHLRVRQGDASAAELLDRAQSLALPTGEIQRIAPMSAARAEGAWWDGDPERTIAEARPGYELASRAGDPSSLGALAYWMARAGQKVPLPHTVPPAYRLMIEGDWAAAAAKWERIGCPFERALALADGNREAKVEALEIFDRLGARPAARALRGVLRREGETKIPRGPRPSTRANPHGLTAGELEVLGLVSEGLSNADIAQRLSISAKTVDHHVSAILSKLSVHSRAEAAAAARRESLLESRQPK
jgi:DNA-binding CsgD family transcriptional regulator/tetratricopeptide (TPR) repeat protein